MWKTLPPLGLALLMTATGCATLQFPWDSKVPEATTRNPVVQITCLWEQSEGRDPNGAPCRGFAGQILFLGNKGGTPVKVDGTVMIYIFDDLGTAEEQVVPIHQFNFDEASWSKHMRVGTMGPTYHVFVPYTRPGVYEANCSLRVKLTSKNGSVLYSDPAEIPLRGKKRNPPPAAEVISHYGQRPEGESRDGPRTTTIPLDGREAAPVDETQHDQDRVEDILQQFLKEQAVKDMDRARQSSAINRGAASERIRWNGESVKRSSPSPQRSLAHLLPQNTDQTAGDHPLSTHPFAEHSQPAPKRVKGLALRHPLADELNYPVSRQTVSAVEADGITDEWAGAEDTTGQQNNADPLDSQTSQFDWRP